MSLLPQKDLPIATSISVFFQFFGGATFLAVGENIFVARLGSSLHRYAPSLDAKAVIAAGATGLRDIVVKEGAGDAALHGALVAYNVAVSNTFYLVAAGAAVATVCAFGIEWRSVKLEQKVRDVESP